MSVCGDGNVDNTTCQLAAGHDGNHYDGIGYWAGRSTRPPWMRPGETAKEALDREFAFVGPLADETGRDPTSMRRAYAELLNYGNRIRRHTIEECASAVESMTAHDAASRAMRDDAAMHVRVLVKP